MNHAPHPDNASVIPPQLLAGIAADDADLARGERLSEILAELEVNPVMRRAAALYPLAAAGRLPGTSIREACGPDCAGLVEHLCHLPEIDELELTGSDGLEARQSENLRRMLLAMVADIRVIVIRLADQLDRIRQARDASPELQRALARATRNLYAPLANRLGIWQLKWELEDWAFRFLEPEAYHAIARHLAERRADREQYIRDFMARLDSALQDEGIQGEIKGRPKHLYSIWRKMQRKQLDLDQLYDLRAVRVLVDTVAQCYTVLGVVHSLWTPVRAEFDDYIATPKENGYRSLHTAVVGPGGRPVEVQIRTHEMNQQAELGIAAHWRYKENARADQAMDRKIAWLRQLLDPEESAGESDFIDRFKSEIFEDRVYVLTPRGEIIDLPAGATPLDFAYHIHTDIGHRCRGARVNGRMTALTTPLNSGNQVEIIVAKSGEPSRDWLLPQLGYLVSPRARAKVKAWFRQRDHGLHVNDGRALLERELTRLGAGDLPYEKLLVHFPTAPDLDTLLALIGAGDISPAQLAGAVERETGGGAKPTRPVSRPRARRQDRAGIQVSGVGNLMTQTARCCRPVPPDSIVGFITRGRGVTVHRADCRNILRAQQENPGRLIEVSWQTGEQQPQYPARLAIEAHDRNGLLHDVTNALSAEHVPITALDSRVDRASGTAHLQVALEIRDLEQLSRVLSRLNRLPGVFAARRQSSQ